MNPSIAIIGDSGITHDARVQRVVKSFASKGFRVDLFLPNTSTNRNVDYLFSEYHVRIFLYDMVDTWINKNLFFWKKFDNSHKSVLETGIKYDFIYVNDYPLLNEGVRLKKIYKNKLIYDSHEIYIETINQFFSITKGFKSLFFWVLIKLNKIVHKSREKSLLKNVDLMISVSQSFNDYFYKTYNVRPVLLKNGPLSIKTVTKKNHFREKFNLPSNSKILLYQGVFNLSRGLEKLVESSRFFNDDIHLVLLGSGPIERNLRLMSENCGNVHFHSMVSQDILIDFTSSADIGILLIEAKNISKELTLPNKVFEYMSAGIPFITNSLPEGSSIVNNFNCGFVINDSSPEIIAEQINKIFLQEYFIKGINGFKAVENHFLWKNDFEHVYEQLINLK